MHAKRHVEVPSRQSPAHVTVSAQSFGFVEGDKLDVANITHQGRFGLADDPGDTGVGPVILEVAHYCECVAGIADRREPENADVFGRRVCEQVRQVDNKGRIR
jgi:hypothetical protein